MGDTKFRQHGKTARGPFRADAKAQRRTEGEQRNAAWRALSAVEQLASLDRRRGKSLHQRVAILAKGAA